MPTSGRLRDMYVYRELLTTKTACIMRYNINPCFVYCVDARVQGKIYELGREVPEGFT